MSSSIEPIENLTKQYADAVDVLTERVAILEGELESVKRRRMRGIKEAVRKVKTLESDLNAKVDGNRHLFKKPRTLVISGIKVGLKKCKGKIQYSSDQAVVARIKKHLPEQQDVLIQTTEKPIKSALGNLPGSDLKRIGVTIEDTTDEVIIKLTDSNVDKLVNALLKEDTDNDEQETEPSAA